MNFIPKTQSAKLAKKAHGSLILLSTLCLVLPILQPKPAQAKPMMSSAEVWPGRRVVLMLPLQLSDNWNADPQWGQRLLFPSERRLRAALEATGKFSVVETYQFDPVLQRALQDKLIEKSQLDALVETPSLQTASGILDKLGFPLKPVIAEFRLEEVRSSGDPKAPSVQVQVLGKLYELGAESASQKEFTSDPIKRRGTQFDQVIEAADNAFRMVANEFVRPPAEIVLPRVETPKVDPKSTGKKPKKGVKPGSAMPPSVESANPVGTAPATAAPVTPPPTVVGPPLTAPIEPTLDNKS